uniref:Uncharacterized protein n=1 Tax=Anguilla anguilla TaxID=7936 RepID=A0A0E9QXY9_ANGAN
MAAMTGVKIPQLVVREDITVLMNSHDWQQHLSPFMPSAVIRKLKT